jgi:hypothetical protein
VENEGEMRGVRGGRWKMRGRWEEEMKDEEEMRGGTWRRGRGERREMEEVVGGERR